VKGRSEGPSAGNKAPASANMHPCKASAQRPAGAFAHLDDIEVRSKSMPSRELIRIKSAKGCPRSAFSLGPLPVDRKALVPPQQHGASNPAANGVHHSPEIESQGLQSNPFATFAA
jgi:hypothetical protein